MELKVGSFVEIISTGRVYEVVSNSIFNGAILSNGQTIYMHQHNKTWIVAQADRGRN